MESYTVIVDFENPVHTSTDLAEVGAVARAARGQTIIVVEDRTGQYLEVDPRTSDAEVRARFQGPAPPERRGRGRPRLGVVSGEVTLLPRHWAWLKSQRGGASATIRRLVDTARKATVHRDRALAAKHAVAGVMGLCGGDRPGYEEGLRHLYADRFAQARDHLEAWPQPLREYVSRLLDEAARCAVLADQELRES